MLKSKQGAGYERLSELISKIGSTIGCFNQYLLGRLIEPVARFCCLLPGASGLHAWIRRHVNSHSGNWNTSLSTCHSVADFSPAAGGSTVKWLNSCGKIMRFCL